MTADIHGSLRLHLDFLYERTGAADADLYILLGDNVEDSMSQPEFYITTGYLDDICRLWGPTKPTMFVRGNHDCGGLQAANGWATWFPRPDRRGYYTIRRGNALFICFDLPQEWNTRGAGPVVAAQYCQEQLAWLRELKRSDEWKTATWRIGCCHYGTRTGNDWNFARFRETFGDELNEAGNSLDLMLCGHEHYYARNDAHSTEIHHNFKYDSDRRKAKPPQFKYLSDKWNFTEDGVCRGLPAQPVRFRRRRHLHGLRRVRSGRASADGEIGPITCDMPAGSAKMVQKCRQRWRFRVEGDEVDNLPEDRVH